MQEAGLWLTKPRRANELRNLGSKAIVWKAAFGLTAQAEGALTERFSPPPAAHVTHSDRLTREDRAGYFLHHPIWYSPLP